MKTQEHTFRTYTPLEYLMIDIATNFGDVVIQDKVVDLDKISFENRIAWFKTQENQGNLVNLIEQADKPALYFAGLQAYDDHLSGRPTGYAISMDACSSGLQILSALANCRKSALHCGVVSTGKREDAYMGIFEAMCQNAGDIDLRATRKDLKQAVMTSLYGSKAQPRRLFGADTPALGLFYDTVETEIPGAWELNKALKGLWQPYATEHKWVLPDNFHVCMTVEDLETDEVLFLGSAVEVYTKQPKGTATGLSLSPNIVHSIDGMIVREISRRCSYDTRAVERARNACRAALSRPSVKRRKTMQSQNRKQDKLLKILWKRYTQSGFLSARVIELIDDRNVGHVSARLVLDLIETLPEKRFDVLAIHDCFRVHPNYGNDLRRQYNYIMSAIAASDMLSDIATQVTGQRQRLIKQGDIADEILNANYALS